MSQDANRLWGLRKIGVLRVVLRGGCGALRSRIRNLARLRGPRGRVRRVWLIGAAGLEPATYGPPAARQSVSMRPWASPASPSSPGVDDLDASDTAVGTKVVPRAISTSLTVQSGVRYVLLR